jgi:arylsulfatase A-like enzyme/predicted amidohydrolase
MKRNRTIGGVLIVSLVLAFLAPLATAAELRRPNFLVILLDNVGPDWFGCYGSTEGQTPTIDRLAAAGVRFENCYTTPFCSTSRVELLTGRYPFRTGWHTHHDAGIYGGGNFDELAETTFAEILRTAGYATAIAGKWQISDLHDPTQADALWRHGFDEQCIWPDGPRTHPAHGKRYWDPYIVQNGRRLQTAGKFGPDVFVDYLVDFMRRRRAQPFLAYYACPLTHGPVVPAPQNRDQSGRSERELFAGMVRCADAGVERLLGALRELKLQDDTIVLLASDNGNEKRFSGKTAGRPREAAGYSLREGGINMPLIVSCPSRIAGNRVLTQLVDFTDILPTLADFAGAALPANLAIDGRSFAPAVLDKPDAKQRDWILSQYAAVRVVRDQRFKLYSTGEFFDLIEDPLEQHNRAADQATALRNAREKLAGILASLPADRALPFAPRSQSAFRLRAERSAPELAAAPDGWQVAAQRAEIAPLAWIERQSSEGEYLLGLAGRGDDGVDGRWVRRFAASAGRTYQFTTQYHARGAATPTRSILARVLWFDRNNRQIEQAEYPPTLASVHDGWRTIEAAYPAPARAASAQVELHLRWAGTAEVLWRPAQLKEAAPLPPRRVRLATVNHRPRGSTGPQQNLEQFARLVGKAAEQKADVVCLPEGITVVGTTKKYVEVAEPIPGPTTEFLGRCAAQHRLYIVAGLYERDGAAVYNTSVLIGRDGKLVGKYRKVCLPREEIDGGITPGVDYPVFDTDFGRVGMMICWDVHFPEVARELAARGAEVILLPIWGGNETLARARAIENQLFLVASGYDFRTAIFDRTGATMRQAESDPEVLVTQVDLNDRLHWRWLGDWRSRIWREAPASAERPASPRQ